MEGILEKYERLPEWSRWILLLPLSLIFSLLAILALSLLRDDFVFMNSTFAIVTFAFAIYSLAPRWKSRLVLASLILRMVISVTVVSLIFILGETPNQQTQFECFGEIIGWAIGWYLYFTVFRKPVGN